MNKIWLAIFSLGTLWLSPHAGAWPVSFGSKPVDLAWHEIITPHFHIYFDKDCQKDGKLVAQSLEAAREYLDQLFGLKRERPLPVVISPHRRSASFANFVTDNLEIQSACQTSPDLIWHEMVHEAMYRHFSNLFGHAGSTLHLIWLPSWFVEGLAEYIAGDIPNYKIRAELFRSVATEDWPTFPSLHSIYHQSSHRGYQFSSALVRYIFEHKMELTQISEFLEYYYWQSMPWMWPVQALAFYQENLPLDQALKKFTGSTSRELFEEFKTAYETEYKNKVLPKRLQTPPEPNTKPRQANNYFFTREDKTSSMLCLQSDDPTHAVTIDPTTSIGQNLPLESKSGCLFKTSVPYSFETFSRDDPGMFTVQSHAHLLPEFYPYHHTEGQAIYLNFWPKNLRPLRVKNPRSGVYQVLTHNEDSFLLTEWKEGQCQYSLATDLPVRDFWLDSSQSAIIWESQVNGVHYQQPLTEASTACPLPLDTRYSAITQNLAVPEIAAAEQITPPEAKPAKSRWRRHFLVPYLWLDSDGWTVGLGGLPFATENLGQEIRFTTTYGVQSQYPALSISYLNRLGHLPFSTTFFRYQEWDGYYRLGTDPPRFHTAYLDTTGANLSLRWQPSKSTHLSLGLTHQQHKEFDSMPSLQGVQRLGSKTDATLSYGYQRHLGKRWQLYLSQNFRSTPDFINTDYEEHRMSTNFQIYQKNRVLSPKFKLFHARTQGDKRKNLAQVYRPVNIFQAGTGANAFEQLYFPITEGGTSFNPQFGLNQAYIETGIEYHVLRDIDRLIRLLYFDQLTIRADFRYGGAWTRLPFDQAWQRTFLFSQIYKLDAQLDLKGFGIFPGVGTVKTEDEAWEWFFSFSMDSVF